MGGYTQDTMNIVSNWIASILSAVEFCNWTFRDYFRVLHSGEGIGGKFLDFYLKVRGAIT